MERAVVRSSARLSGGGGGPSKSSGGDKASSRAEAARRAAAAALAAERRARARQRAEEVEDSPSVLREKCRELARVIRQAKHLVVYTGAGISTAADIPDYRGPHGVWTRLQRGEEIGRVEVSRARPTFTHMALTALVARGLCKFVVSQNCDGLHVRAGLPRRALAELHGDMFAERCAAPRCRAVLLRAFDTTQRTRRHAHGTRRTCPAPRCGRPLRDTIVHFGERARAAWPLNWAGALRHAAAADVILCLGSSLKVLRRYPRLWCMARPPRARPRLYIVNLQWTPKDTAAELKINARCDAVMRELARRLRVRVPRYRRSRDPLLAHATPLAPAELHTCSRPVLAPASSPSSASSSSASSSSASDSDSDDALPLRRLQERLRGERPRANGCPGPGARLDGPWGQWERPRHFPADRPRGASQVEGVRKPPRPGPPLGRLQRPVERSSDPHLPTEGLRPRSPPGRARDRLGPAERFPNVDPPAGRGPISITPQNYSKHPQSPEECPRDRHHFSEFLRDGRCAADELRNRWYSPLTERLRGPEAPAERLRDPAERPRDPAERPRDPAERPRDPAERLRDPAERPRNPAERPRDPAERPRDPAERPRDPAERPRDPAERPRDPAERPRDPAERPRDPAKRPLDPALLEPEEKKPKLENGVCGAGQQEHLTSFEVCLADGPARILLHAAHAPEPKEEEDEGGGLARPPWPPGPPRPPRPPAGPGPAVKQEEAEGEASRAAAAFIARAVLLCRGQLYPGLHTILAAEPAGARAGAAGAGAPGEGAGAGGECAWCWRRHGSRRCLWYPAREPAAPGRVWRRVRGRRYLCTCCPRAAEGAPGGAEGAPGGAEGAPGGAEGASSGDEGGEGGWYGKGYRKGRRRKR